MRIGIFPNLFPASGGAYQYSQNILQTLNAFSENGCRDKFVLLSNNATFDTSSIALSQESWEIRPIVTSVAPSLSERVLDKIRGTIGEGPHRDCLRWCRRQLANFRNGAKPKSGTLSHLDLIKSRNDLQDSLSRLNLQLLFYTFPTDISFEAGMPYIIVVHDLQHRLQPEFPEVSAAGQWEHREYMFRNGCRYADLIVAESEVGKEDILKFYGPYGVTEDKVKVLPYLPASYLATDITSEERERVRATYHLPERYLFYPAQFWPHKNHDRIVQALALLKRRFHMEIPVVFCGSHAGEIRKNTYDALMSLCSSLGIDAAIHCLGYVPDKQMSALYSGATALVMPTFFGPTNIPVLEAWAFNCPVLTSDIRGIREQVGDAAILVDPRSVESIAEGIYLVWMDERLRENLAAAGRRRLSLYSPDDFRKRLMGILKEAKDRVRSRETRVRRVAIQH